MLLDLAEHRDQAYIPLKDIAERQGISKKYLEQIAGILNQSGILRANRGYQGGFMLAQPPEKYTVGQILRITEGNLSPVACLETDLNECERSGYCKTLYVWQGLDNVVNEYFDSITLKDIIDSDNGENSGNTSLNDETVTNHL